MVGKLGAVAGGRPQVFSTWAPPTGCLSVLVTWQLTSPRVNQPREWELGKSSAVYDLLSEATQTSLLPHSILQKQVTTSGHPSRWGWN